MKKLIYFSILVMSFVAQADPMAPARSQCLDLFRVKTSSVSETFQELAFNDQLISQLDYRLWQRGFLIDNGGLCASTCGVNVLQALYKYIDPNASRFNPDRRINQLIVIAREQLGVDARDGLELEQLGVVLEKMNSSLTNYSLKTQLFKPVTEWDISPPPGALHIASISVGSKDYAHAIVLLEVDQFHRTVVFADPYHPEAVMEVPYREHTVNGETQFHLVLDNPDRLSHYGQLIEILRLEL